MSPTDGFDLRSLIREVADSSTIPDPATLAVEVQRRIPAKHRGDALAQALPMVVTQVVARSRSPITSDGQSERDAHCASAGGGTSRKVAAIRSSWRKMLRDRIAVGPDAGGWKFLGECDVDDLGYAATVREAHAKQNAEKAAQFRQLAERLERAGVETVSQLSDADLGEALGAAA